VQKNDHIDPTYLDLCVLYLLEHWATSCVHRTWSLATILTSPRVSLPLTPISCISSINVSRHVRFGLPHLLLLSSRIQSITRLAGLDVGRRNTCPMNLFCLFATVSCKSRKPALLCLSFHDTPIMSRRHLLLNTLSIMFVLSVVLHVADGVIDVSRLIGVFFSYIFYLHTGRRHLSTEEAFPIRV